MLTRSEALLHLNKEKNYEDKLVYELSSFFISELPKIDGLTKEQRSLIERNLMIIIRDSLMHSEKFGELITMVLENGDNTQY